MKTTRNKIKWSTFFSVTFVLLFIYVKPVLAGNYLGEFCWKTDPAESSTYAIAKFAVTDVGGGHYTLHGTFTTYEESGSLEGTIIEATTVAHGSAEMIGTVIVMTLTETHYSEKEDLYGFGVIRLQLNPQTLSGTFKTTEVGHVTTEGDQFYPAEYEYGSIDFLPTCD